MIKFSILTANFNNKYLTDAMIRSFRKQYGKCHVYVIDNSTEQKYTTNLENVTIIDNFNYKNTPDVYEHAIVNYGKTVGRPSVLHSGSIEYAFNKIEDEYIILCDNDIMFYPSIKKLLYEFDQNECDVLGEIGIAEGGWPTNRLFPFMCLINLKKIKQNNIHFYTLNSIVPYKKDTGAYFLEELNKHNIKIQNIKLKDYITHLGHASWNNTDVTSFLEQTKKLRPMISIIMPTHKKFDKLHITLYSVFSQSYKDWELIVVDSSNDKYFEKYLDEELKSGFFKSVGIDENIKKKIKIIKPTEYTRCPGNMYVEGIKNTSCGENEFIVFLDHDDFLANYLLENIYDISYKYPHAQMISGDIIKPTFKGMELIDNTVRRDYQQIVGTHPEIWIANYHITSDYPIFNQLRNFHDFLSFYQPKIIRKKEYLENRYKIHTNTESGSDVSFRIHSIALKEVYILDTVYYFVQDLTNSSVGDEVKAKKRIGSQEVADDNKLYYEFTWYLERNKYKKDRIYYTPKNRNFIV